MLKVMNTSFQMLAELQPIFLQWKRKYYRSDEFMIKVPLNSYTERLNYIIYNDRCGVILTKITEGDIITISGKEYGFPVFKRVVDSDTQTGAAETLQKYYVTSNCITPLQRRISNFTVESDQSRGVTFTYPARFQDLEVVLHEIYLRSGLGWEVIYDSGFIFKTVEGKDRSVNGVLNPVIFAEKYGNLTNPKVIDSTDNYFNVGIVGGQGTGGGRMIETVGTATGNSRYELFIDAQNLSTSALLISKGNEVLQNYSEIIQLDGKFVSTTSFQYGVDYFVGDIVTVIHENYSLDLRLVEVHETKDTQDTLDFVFGHEPRTIQGLINDKINLINSEVRI